MLISNDHPEYQGALAVLTWRHICRLQTWPDSLKRSISPENMNAVIFATIQGRNEFTFTGNLKDWNRLADVHRIFQPTLLLSGLHDEVTPDCAARMHRVLPDSRIKVFPNSSHLPFLEEPDAYFEEVERFLSDKSPARH